MLKKIERLAPHGVILICNMYIVFFLIDRVNPAMNFIDNGLTKGLLAVMCLLALWDAWRLLKPVLFRRGAAPARVNRAATASASRPGAGGYAPRPAASRSAAPRGVQPQRRGSTAARPPVGRTAQTSSRPASRPVERRAPYGARDSYATRSTTRREGERR